jgi:hypothetical protein
LTSQIRGQEAKLIAYCGTDMKRRREEENKIDCIPCIGVLSRATMERATIEELQMESDNV